MEQNNYRRPKSWEQLIFSWLIWFLVDQDELNKQVYEYETLSIWRSARKLSALLITGLCIISSFGLMWSYLSHAQDGWLILLLALFMNVLFLPCAFYIYKGSQSATLIMMGLWSYLMYNTLKVVPTFPIFVFYAALWAIFMHPLYVAFRVEREKERISENPEELKKLAPNNITKRTFLRWLFWWKLDNNELDWQVQNYNHLKFYQSSRGISVIWLLCSIFTSLIIFTLQFHYLNLQLNNLSTADYFTLALTGLFFCSSIFLYNGYKWAIIIVMILWSILQINILFAYRNHESFLTLLIHFCWWCIYMHLFYYAFKVEQLRVKNISTL